MNHYSAAVTGPHQGQPVLHAGASLEHARAAVVMIHGRGARAEDILLLAGGLPQTGIAYLAPQANDNSWYPNRFMEPIESNEPWLSSALALVESLLAEIARAGTPPHQTVLLGFSQGACLTLEYAARHAQHYGGVIGLSGGLIGPEGTSREYKGTLAGTPVFLGCSESDPHIPKDRVFESAKVLTRLGGLVTARLYPNLGHEVNADELEKVSEILSAV
jgi:predicted esterase